MKELIKEKALSQKIFNEGFEAGQAQVQHFADSIKNNPEEIISWARGEIKEYENLIKILESTPNTKGE